MMTAYGCRWNPEPASLSLHYSRVDVWAARLDQDAELVERLAGTLSPDERARAGRFVFPEHHRRFIVARGILRDILGRYRAAPPETLEFVYTAHGKPWLAGAPDLRFNVTHSHELAVYAAAYRRDVGVDLEYMRPIADMEQLAARCFSPAENAAWRMLSGEEQTAGFFNCWTRKEAYLKAIGDGLTYPLGQFDVSLKPGEPAQLLRVAGDTHAALRWTLQALQPAEGYTAALAVEGRGWYLRCWRWGEATA